MVHTKQPEFDLSTEKGLADAHAYVFKKQQGGGIDLKTANYMNATLSRRLPVISHEGSGFLRRILNIFKKKG